MKTKFWLILCFLSFIFASCEKWNPTWSSAEKKERSNPLHKDSLLIEEYIHDSTGVVFKIVNDLDFGYNYQENLIQKIDSVYLRKFHIFIGDTNMYSPSYTWFSKKGQYVCWRYNYIGIDEKKLIDIGFPNHIRYYNPWKYCGFLTYVYCSEALREYPENLRRFPKPINDTVYCKLSSFFPDKLW